MKRGEEDVHLGFGAALVADKDWSSAVEISDDDAGGGHFPDGDFAHAAALLAVDPPALELDWL